MIAAVFIKGGGLNILVNIEIKGFFIIGLGHGEFDDDDEELSDLSSNQCTQRCFASVSILCIIYI